MAAEIVKRRAGGKCEHCGKSGPTDWAHIVARRFHSVRWNPDNALSLCRPCHRYFTDRPATFTAWLMDWKGRDWVTSMEVRANEQWDRSYERVIADLSERLTKKEED